MTLLELQRRMAGAMMAPLSAGDHLAAKAPNGRAMRAEVGEIIKPNDRLSPVERLEIYAKSYWYRILDALADDFPGLRAIVGSRAFTKLARAYLTEMPSQSFTLRDLGSRLAGWLEEHPEYAGRNPVLARDMVRLEWAHVEAFDGPAEKVLGPEDLVELNSRMTFHLQPYVTLLELQYPVDDLHVRVSELAEGHSEASNARLRHKERRAVRRFSLQPERIYLAVHRIDEAVYYRRMEAGEFRLLDGLGSGKPMGDAIESAFEDSTLPLEELRGNIEGWFSAWSELGWFCRARGESS